MKSTDYAFVLLRHGQSVGNAEGRFQGHADFPLTELGRSQAQAIGKRWLNEERRFDAIISSPLPRAKETAEIVGTILGVTVELDPLWMERNNGAMAGLKHEDIQARKLEPEFLHPYYHIGNTGESELELHIRAAKGVQSLLDRPPGRYLVVSHGGTLNKTLAVILGFQVQANFQGASFRFGNTGFAVVTYSPDEHRWRFIHFETP